jgi:hypothetical protein
VDIFSPTGAVLYYQFCDVHDRVLVIPTGSLNGVVAVGAGGPLAPFEHRGVLVPAGCRYFARIAAGAGTVILEKTA